jgi:hypothetical protein
VSLKTQTIIRGLFDGIKTPIEELKVHALLVEYATFFPQVVQLRLLFCQILQVVTDQVVLTKPSNLYDNLVKV